MICRVFASLSASNSRTRKRTTAARHISGSVRSMIHYSRITILQSGGGQRIHCISARFSISICHTHTADENGVSRFHRTYRRGGAPRPAAGNADLNKTTRGSDHIQCPSTQILRAHIFIASCASSFSELAAQLAGGGARRRGTILSTASLSS